MDTPMRLEMEEDMAVYKKEQELREIVTSRIRTLTLGQHERDEEISVLRMKLAMLDKDFRCNLQQLHEKEEEIDDLELELQGLQTHLVDKTGEISKLLEKVDDMEKRISEQSREMKTNEGLFRDKITEMNNKMEELHRQTETKLQQCEKEKEEECQRYERQIHELQSDLSLQKTKLEEDHDAAISRIHGEHNTATQEFMEAVQNGESRIKKLEEEIKILQTQRKTLSKDQTNTENKVKEIASLYKYELNRLSNTCESQKSDFENKLQSIEQQLEKERNNLKELVKFTQEKFRENNICVSDDLDKFDDIERIVQFMKQGFADIFNDINKHIQENQLLKQKCLQYSKNKAENQSKDGKSEQDLKLLKHQNTILKEIIKNMRHKINHINFDSSHENAITESAIIFHSNNAIGNGNNAIENGNNAIEVDSSEQIPNRPMETNEIIKNCNDLPTNRCQDNFHQCHSCEDLKQELSIQRQESYEQLQILKNKIEKLTTDVPSRGMCEDTARLQNLEETITYLKNRMMNDLKEKLQKQGDSETDKMTITDVRMMLLEQKLERITSNIGEAMTSEKDALLKAVHLVKEELKTLLQETKKNEKCIKKNDAPRKKNDEMVAKVLSEIIELKEKLKKSCNDELKREPTNKGLKERVKIIKHMQCNIPNHVNFLATNQKTTDDLVPEYNSHTNLIQEQTSSQSRYVIQDRMKPVSKSSPELGIDEVWALLNEPIAQNTMISGPTARKVVLHTQATKSDTLRNIPATSLQETSYKNKLRK